MSPLLFTQEELDDHALLSASRAEREGNRELTGRDRMARGVARGEGGRRS